jgi:SNF family Na+-dependent transporter
MEKTREQQAWENKSKPIMWTIITLMILGGISSLSKQNLDSLSAVLSLIGLSIPCYFIYWFNKWGFIRRERNKIKDINNKTATVNLQ